MYTQSKGKGGFKTILLIMNTFPSFVWAYKLKSAGTVKSTLMGLQDLSMPSYHCPDMGLSLQQWGSEWVFWGQTHNNASICPQTNGLVENANKLLLGHLNNVCTQPRWHYSKWPGPRVDSSRVDRQITLTRPSVSWILPVLWSIPLLWETNRREASSRSRKWDHRAWCYTPLCVCWPAMFTGICRGTSRGS